MIGNVWEWVDGDVVNGEFDGREVPMAGYVSGVDSAGVPIGTQSQPDPAFNMDYFWSLSDGVLGMIRGGYWGNDSDAGLYSINASIPPTFTGRSVGFRCAKSL
jgi:formylglycine-generating enzyme required for sulfatase activity